MARVCAKRGVLLSAAAVIGACGLVGAASADHVKILVRAGTPLPGAVGSTAPTVTLSRLGNFTNASSPIVNSGGDVVFTAQVSGSGVTTSNNMGIWRMRDGGSPVLVARTGMAAPGLSLTFSALSSPMLSETGRCAFQGTLSGSGVNAANSRSFWACSTGQPSLLVRESESATVADTSVFIGSITAAEWIKHSSTGQLLFQSTLSGTGVTTTNNKAIWSDNGGSSASGLVRTGTPMTWLPMNTVCRDPFRIANDYGATLVYGTLSGSGVSTSPVPTDQFLAVPSPTGRRVIRSGVTAVGGVSSDLRYSSLFTTTTLARKPQFNNDGDMVFAPTLVTPNGAVVGSGLFMSRDGAEFPIVLAGDRTAEMPAGVSVGTALGTSLATPYYFDSAGVVHVVSFLTGPGVSFASDRALLRWSDGVLRMVARGGQQAPGAPAGVIITNDSIGRTWRFTRSGDVVFAATLAGPGVDTTNDIAIFSTVGGGLRMIAREGEVVPDSGGWRLASLATEPNLIVNSLGQVIFPANALGGPSGIGNTQGWFRVDQNHQLRVLGLSSEIVPGQTGDVLRSGMTSPNSLISFSDAGEAVFMTVLESGSTGGTGEAVVSIKISSYARSDINQSGSISVEDIWAFLGDYLGAGFDYNRDGDSNVADLFDFLADYFARQ